MAILGCPEAIFGAHGGVILKGARGSFKNEATLVAKMFPKDANLNPKQARRAIPGSSDATKAE